jgi:hypothetical protein
MSDTRLSHREILELMVNPNGGFYFDEYAKDAIRWALSQIAANAAEYEPSVQVETWWNDNVNQLRIEAEESDDDEAALFARAAWQAALAAQ